MAIGIVLTFSLGLGLLFLHFYTAYASLATNILFGNVLGIDVATVKLLAVLAAGVLLALGAIARPLVFASLQPELAEARGVRQDVTSALFMAIVAVSTAEAIQIVGVLLVFALMVAPAASAARLTRTVGAGVALSVAPGAGGRVDQPDAGLLHRLADELLDHDARRGGLRGEPRRPLLPLAGEGGPAKPGRMRGRAAQATKRAGEGDAPPLPPTLPA